MATIGKRVVPWVLLAMTIVLPVSLATASPYLEYRSLPYLLGGFAGIVALAILLIQPLLALGYLPGLSPARSRHWHRSLGALLVTSVVFHLGGLYLTSPADTLDALLLRSPTPFSVYGVIALLGVLGTSVLVAAKRPLRGRTWRRLHRILAAVIVIATVIHAVQIEGAMEAVSKWGLCLAALATTLAAILQTGPLKSRRGRFSAIDQSGNAQSKS